MAWETVFGATNPGRSVALYPGAWDPPTVAHLAVARAARQVAGHVVWVLPRAFPHKPWNPVGIEQRTAMLSAIAAAENKQDGAEGFSVVITDGGLFHEIADEARAHFGLLDPERDTEISLVCGRDAAERMATWDYGAGAPSPRTSFEDLLARHRLLVAARAGEYDPAKHVDPCLVERVSALLDDSSFDLISSSEVRRRIAAGEPWESLVPAVVVKMVRDLYVPAP